MNMKTIPAVVGTALASLIAGSIYNVIIASIVTSFIVALLPDGSIVAAFIGAILPLTILAALRKETRSNVKIVYYWLKNSDNGLSAKSRIPPDAYESHEQKSAMDMTDFMEGRTTSEQSPEEILKNSVNKSLLDD